VMDVALYTGNAASRSITGLGFSPDFVWIKNRSNATGYFHALFDIVRGANRILASNSTAAEDVRTQQLTAFNSDGFTLGDNSDGGNYVNRSSDTYVAWAWDAGSSTVTNTQGSISSQVRANASAGFSVVTYTGNATAGATVGHGLGVQPEIVIGKNRGGGDGWFVWSKAVNSGGTAFLKLNTTDALSSTQFIANDTAPNSTVITLGSDTGWNSNQSPGMVLYCFAPVAGYSSFGSYTGNGSADGPFVFLNFRARWIMFKRVAAADPWIMYDTARSQYNQLAVDLAANDSRAEAATSAVLDITSNGFKLRNSGTIFNQSGSQYIYCAFAESPFQYARAR